MNIALVNMPCTLPDSPPVGLAGLYSALTGRADGYQHNVRVFDFNIEYFIHNDVDYRQNFFFESNSTFSHPDAYRILHRTNLRACFREWLCRIMEHNVEAVGFTLFPTSINASVDFARHIKGVKPECLIIFGGPHLNALSPARRMRLMKSGVVDALFLGECEKTLPDFLVNRHDPEAIKRIPGLLARINNRLIQTAGYGRIDNLDELIFPDFSGFPLELYRKKELPLCMFRGCPGRCAFCDNPLYGGFRMRSVISVVEEIKYQISHTGIHKFHASVADFNSSPEFMTGLADRLDKENIRIEWGGQALPRPDLNRRYFKRLHDSGLRYVNFGVESGSDRIVKRMGKNIKARKTRGILRCCRQLDMEITTYFMVGFPGETPLDFLETLILVYSCRKYIDHLFVGAPCVLSYGSDLRNNPHKYDICRIGDAYNWKENNFLTFNNYIFRRIKYNILYHYGVWLGLAPIKLKRAKADMDQNLLCFAQGMEHFRKGRYRKSLNAFSTHLISFPDDTGCVSYLIIAADRSGSEKAAWQTAEIVKSTISMDMNGCEIESREEEVNRIVEQFIDTFKFRYPLLCMDILFARGIRMEDFRLWRIVGHILKDRGELQEAVQCLRPFIHDHEIAVDTAWCLEQIGSGFFENRKWRQAYNCFSEAAHLSEEAGTRLERSLRWLQDRLK